MYQIGGVIEFTDEFGFPEQSIIVALDPYGMKGMLGIQGSYGCYVRSPEEVKEVFGHHNLFESQRQGQERLGK